MRLTLLLVLGLTTQPLGAQTPVTRALAPGVSRFPEPFSLVRAVREVSDGRVLVADWIEERLVVLDWGAGSVQAVGRSGPGPSEYRLPGGLVALPGDTTLLIDVGNQRLTLIDPDFTVVGSVTPPVRYPIAPRSADRLGGLYYAVPGWAVGAAPGDSVTLARWDRRTGTVTDVALVQGSTPRPDANQPRRTPGIPFVVFAPQDAWVATAAGDVLVVRAHDYRVERRTPDGTWSRGPAHEWAPGDVTAEERRAFVRRFLASSPMSGRGPDGGLGQTPSEAQTTRAVEEMVRTNSFAARHPYFDAGGVWLAGEVLWVQRGGSTEQVVLDGFDLHGRLTQRVMLPAGRRVVGFGRGVLYAVTADEDGLEWLERYPL